MPLLKRKPYQPSFTAPEGFNLGAEVFVVRFTGELFTSYEDYARAVKLYRTRDWVCQLTGRSGLSYEEALVSEQRSRTLIAKFPACYEEPVVRMVHHALAKPDEMVTRLLAHFKERLVPGEEAVALRNGAPAPCIVVQSLGPDGLDAEEIDELQVLDMEYEVEWLRLGEDDIEGDGAREVLARGQIGRKRSPLTRLLLKSWLQEAATCEMLENARGPPCLWSVIPELAEKWGLPQHPPRDLLERIDVAAKKKAARAKKSTEKMGRSRKSPVKLEAYEAASPSGEGEPGESPLMSSLRSMKAEDGYPASSEAAPDLMDPALEEGLEEAEQRMQPGTIKHALFHLLKEAGPRGSTLGELVNGVQQAGLKSWTDMRIAKSSIASTCGHDLAFGRLPHGRFALRGLPGVRQALASHPGSANFGAAAAKLKQGRGGVKAEPGRTPLHEPERTSVVEKNIFKCPRCYKVNHPEASPLLLCDTCPRSFHMACLGLSWDNLPDGDADWYCPRCVDRHAAASRNMGYPQDMVADGGQRVVRRLTEKEEREKRKADERAAKEEVKLKEKEEKEKARAEARRAARFPIDDLELQEEERAGAEALETTADQLSQEAHIARQRLQRLAGLCGHNLAQLDPAEDWGLEELGSLATPPEESSTAGNPSHRPDLSTAVEKLMALQQRAADAVDRANKLQLIVEGPPQLRVALTSASLAAWRDSLSIVDFLHCFAPLYLLSSRAARMSGRLEIPNQADKAACMEDDLAAVWGAHTLITTPYHKVDATLHVRLLAVLCNDVVEGQAYDRRSRHVQMTKCSSTQTASTP
ncbi:hypothetical protein WJX84_004504 [Apatococcus fuscideae]|uniref:Uncharacterized protein n=1 Tax=Apatococcus fuscideae TaxID=2026836 RepID=A0AAW1T7J0_9CHLO